MAVRGGEHTGRSESEEEEAKTASTEVQNTPSVTLIMTKTAKTVKQGCRIFMKID